MENKEQHPPPSSNKISRKRASPICLKSFYDEGNIFEIGVDECARGPLFGRLYVSATVLPKDNSFHHEWMKDSKKIHSIKKMKELSEYIKQNSIAWHIHYIEAKEIDEINIRQSVLKAMKECIWNVLKQLNADYNKCLLVVDGNDFTSYLHFDEKTNEINPINHITIEKGDNIYSFIASASILAKNAHDEYILDLCEKYPELKTKYHLHENFGYGTKKHIEGIKQYGITQWHRKSFGICKKSVISEIKEIVDDNAEKNQNNNHLLLKP